QSIGSCPVEFLDHAADDRRLRMQPDNRIAQGHDKRLVANQWLGAEHGVAQTKLLPLPRVKVVEPLPFEIQLFEKFFLARLAQQGNQLGVDIEVIFDRRLARSRYEQQAANA